jgi:hypothetical protein
MRRTLKNGNALKPEWDRYIFYASIGVWVVWLIMETTLPDAVSGWVWHLILVGMVYILYKRPEFFSIRNVLYALVPFVALSIIKDVVKLPDNDFFKKVDDIMDYAIPFTIVWMIVMWLVSNKQQRALQAKERSVTGRGDQPHHFIWKSIRCGSRKDGRTYPTKKNYSRLCLN